MNEQIYDKEHMLDVIESMPRQIQEAYALATSVKITGKVDKIIICGMGGSSVSGLLLKSYIEELKIPVAVFIVQDYTLPAFADAHALIFIISYSGNTEESLSCFAQCTKKGLTPVCIATGGKLEQHAHDSRKPFIPVPKGLQPRNAVAYLFFPMIKVLEQSGIINPVDREITQLVKTLQAQKESYRKIAEKLSESLYTKLPLVYASERFYPVAYRWKCEINENTKIPAFCNRLPELNHNELNGYVNYDKQNLPIHIVILQDADDHRRVQKRMAITKKLIKQMSKDKITFSEVHIVGDTMLSKIFSTIYLGDLVSFYLAMQYFTDPSPVDIIETFKKEMGPYV